MKRLKLIAFLCCLPMPAMAYAPSDHGAVDPLFRSSGNYKLSGSLSIRPSLIWDDGRKTFLNWPAGTDAPAIFAIDGAGQESLVNSYFRDGRYVVDAVFSRLVFRLDRLTARAERRPDRP